MEIRDPLQMQYGVNEKDMPHKGMSFSQVSDQSKQ